MLSSIIKKTYLRRIVISAISFVALIGTLIYVEHPSMRAFKNLASIVGLIDSQYTILGTTDIRSVDHTLGDIDANIVLLEYSDFTCVLCAAMQEHLQRFVRENKALLVSRHLYIASGGTGYERAVAAECVAKHSDEEKYREYMQFLYSQQYAIEDQDDLISHAVVLGVDAGEFASCINEDIDVRSHITKDSEDGFALGAKGTPYIVVVYRGVPVGVSYANDYTSFSNRVRDLIQSSEYSS